MGRRAGGTAALAALLTAMAAGGCLGGHPLPTGPRPVSDSVCNMAGISGTLQGSADDPAVAWLVTGGRRRVDVTWPWGFTATFQPDLILLGPDRTVVARSGDVLDLAGGWIADTGGFSACVINGTFYLGDP